MAFHWSDWPDHVLVRLREGSVIPASPLALTAGRLFNPQRQKSLVRYYIDAGAGGIAIGVHTTQFEIREKGIYTRVLETVADEINSWAKTEKEKHIIKIAGLLGKTNQARSEADVARNLGYHAGLLNLATYKDANEDEIIEHCEAIADIMPLVGFYLQPAVGGIVLSSKFWQQFSMIENVIAIKVAPFNRYQTLDVLRGIAQAKAENRISVYTGNDDNIVIDLITPYEIRRDNSTVTLRTVGGLLGHWAIWVKGAVEILRKCKEGVLDESLLALHGNVTDCNAAIFDVANNFKGCISGVHEILRRQGLFEGIWCLNPNETLSQGQMAEIDRVYRDYPELNDDAFVKKNLDRWLSA
ncbi:dihydrodipicolinate synthase family protein [Rhodospirillales bacterium]|nr:dihydrodipicolinate synthase family protein [Rhodospirillales bacterium]